MKQLKGDTFLKDFLKVEINEDTYQTIYDYISLSNFRYGEYEGNQYVIRKMNLDYVQIEDEVATMNTRQPEVHVYQTGRLQYMLELYKKYIEG